MIHKEISSEQHLMFNLSPIYLDVMVTHEKEQTEATNEYNTRHVLLHVHGFIETGMFCVTQKEKYKVFFRRIALLLFCFMGIPVLC